METFAQDVRYALRLLIRSPGVTAAALIALALGTGVNTALFSIVNTVLLRPLPFPDAHQLLQVWRTELPRLQYGSVSFPRYVDWRSRNRVFQESGAWRPGALTMTGREQPERVAGGRATASFFRTLAAPPAAGRYFSDDEDRPGGAKVVVLGEPFWARRFGRDPGVVGSTITLDGSPHVVVGIAPAIFTELWRVEAWTPLAMEVDQTQRGANALLFVGRLEDGMTAEEAQAGLRELAAEMERGYPGTDFYGFYTLTLQEVLTRGPGQALWILLGATGVVLLIACANVANLLLARAVVRQREMAVRTALGAARWRLTRQLLTEALLLGAIGGALGLGLAAGLLHLFAIIAPPSFPRLAAIGLDLRVLGFATFVATATGVLAGVIPALHTTGAAPADTLRDSTARGATSGRVRRLSRALVASEIALAVVLVSMAGLTVLSLQRLSRQDLGLDAHGVLTFSVNLPGPATDSGAVDTVVPRTVDFVHAFETRLSALPGVNAVGAIHMLPIASTGMNSPVRVPGQVIRPEESPLAEFRAVTPGYFGAMGIPVLAGRGIDPRDRSNTTPVAVINETLATALWPGQPLHAIVGRQIGSGFDEKGNGAPAWRQIVGVSRDVRSRRPDQPPDAELYVPHAQYSMPTMVYAIRAEGQPEALVPAIRRVLAEMDPNLPLASVRRFDDVVAQATRNPRLYSVLTGVFGLLAAMLAVVGIYSVMSYSVAQRRRELAIRSALGASREGVVALVMREGVWLSAIGIGIGLLGVAGASQVMRTLLYGVSPMDPVVLSLASAGIAAAAAAGVLVPAIRAARVHPATSLRSE